MTDDTGQPTVDRLAALEAALRLMLTHGERCNWFADRGDEEVCDQARAALDAASPLTTPTPDPGALEQARELLMPFNGQHLVADDISQDSAWNVLRDEIAELVTAAASEARAAGLMQAKDICFRRSAWAADKIETEDGDDLWANYSNACDDCATLIDDAARALATPAQSETP